MAGKKDNLPLTIDYGNDTSGTITYANEVIAIIAGVAANEVDGVAGMCSNGISEVFGRNKNITKGVKVELGTEEVAIDVYLNVEYGTPIQTAAANVQENVRKAVESMTGLHIVRVDVHVQGVSFEKEQQETREGLESLETLESLQNAETPEAPKPAAEPAPEQAPAPKQEPVVVFAETEEAPAAETSADDAADEAADAE